MLTSAPLLPPPRPAVTTTEFAARVAEPVARAAEFAARIAPSVVPAPGSSARVAEPGGRGAEFATHAPGSAAFATEAVVRSTQAATHVTESALLPGYTAQSLLVPVLLLTLAVLVWPNPAARRLRALTPQPQQRMPRGRYRMLTRPRFDQVSARSVLERSPRPGLTTALIVCVGLALWLAGPAGAIAATIAVATLTHLHRVHRRSATSLSETEGLAEALRSLVADLRAGAHPAQAAHSAATDAHPVAARALHIAATALHHGTDVEAALHTLAAPPRTQESTRPSADASGPAPEARPLATRPAPSRVRQPLRRWSAFDAHGPDPETRPLNRQSVRALVRVRQPVDPWSALGARGPVPAAPPLDPTLRTLGRAWRLATRHGLPLADVLDAVRADLDHRVRFARQVKARLAGARASAALLAGFPVAAIALGEAIDAAPLAVLTTTMLGNLCLVVGVALTCAGLTWTAHLTRKAATP